MEQLTTTERLAVFNKLSGGNLHLWSKGKIQAEKAYEVFQTLLTLAKEDPLFLAHLVSRDNTKDLDVLSTIANFKTDADGSYFEDKTAQKPDLRYVSQAKILQMEPALAYRTLWFSLQKYQDSRFLTKKAKEAFVKYLRYREINTNVLKGAVDHGLKEKIMYMYRVLHLKPSDEAVKTLRWKQRVDRGFVIEKKENPFDGLTPKEVAEKIVKEKIPFQLAVSQIGEMTPIIGKALFKVANPRQAAIYSATWETLGLFNNPEFSNEYKEKILVFGKGDETDRTQRVEKLSGEAKKVVEEVKSEQRKQEFGKLKEFGINKVYIHADFSGSLSAYSKEVCKLAAMFAELVSNPKENLRWGIFSMSGKELNLPETFTQGNFEKALYGRRLGGSTNTMALMPKSIAFGSDLDVFITDGQDNCNRYDRNNLKARRALVVKVGNYDPTTFHVLLNDVFASFSEIDYGTLDNSAKIVEAISIAIKGETAIVDEIMNTKLLELPKWWNLISAK